MLDVGVEHALQPQDVVVVVVVVAAAAAAWQTLRLSCPSLSACGASSCLHLALRVLKSALLPSRKEEKREGFKVVAVKEVMVVMVGDCVCVHLQDFVYLCVKERGVCVCVCVCVCQLESE